MKDAKLTQIKNKMRLTEITTLYETPSFKGYRCTRSGSAFTFSFSIFFSPNLVCLAGDCGHLMLALNWDYALPWLRGSRDSLQYLLEKIPYEIKQSYLEFDAESACALVREPLKELKEQLEEGLISQEAYDTIEEKLENFCEKCLEMDHERDFYEEYLSLCDELDIYVELENIHVTKYTDALWHKVAQLQEFCRLYEERESKNAENL